jgi:hypothetical protein
VALSTILGQRFVSSIDQVVALMRAIELALPPSDGVRSFNHLYLRVTVAVRTAMADASGFADLEFLNGLDVVFANLYFDALTAGDGDPAAAPPAWRPLLYARATPHVLPLQYALAGMNAHINRDLPAGIVAMFEQLGGDPSDRGSRYEDFRRVNDILERVESEVKAEFATGIVGVIDAATAPIDDHVAMWSVRAARETAWTNAEVLWALRSKPLLRHDYFDRLDRFTGFAARGLLIPAVAKRD